MAAHIILKAVNDVLVRRGYQARLEKASGYFYFWSGEASGWIDATVRVDKISAREPLCANGVLQVGSAAQFAKSRARFEV